MTAPLQKGPISSQTVPHTHPTAALSLITDQRGNKNPMISEVTWILTQHLLPTPTVCPTTRVRVINSGHFTPKPRADKKKKNPVRRMKRRSESSKPSTHTPSRKKEVRHAGHYRPSSITNSCKVCSGHKKTLRTRGKSFNYLLIQELGHKFTVSY